jgi:excisionase family DNA binding protein
MRSELEDGDVEKIAEKVLGTLKPYLAETTRDQGADNIMDVKGLCNYLKVTPKWVHERTHLKEIPHYKLSSKQLRFRKRDIDKWLDSMKISAINSLSSKVRLIK